jgi:hypothetical protein
MARDRKTKICPRCEEIVKERELEAKKRIEKKPSRGRVTTSAPKQIEESPSILTEELKNQILGEYESYKDQKNLPIKKIHGEIARKLRIRRMLVAQALQGIAGMKPLSAEEEAEVITRYRDYVEKMERPPAGRRKTIARDMGIPFRTVVAVVREWKRSQVPMGDLTRDQRFWLEKTYFRLLEGGKSLGEIFKEITQESGFNRWQVIRYLDLLHDGEERLEKAPEVTAEQKEKILAGYFDYLKAPSPPGPFLHTLLAEESGTTHQQVHKVLLTYRLSRLREI